MQCVDRDSAVRRSYVVAQGLLPFFGCAVPIDHMAQELRVLLQPFEPAAWLHETLGGPSGVNKNQDFSP